MVRFEIFIGLKPSDQLAVIETTPNEYHNEKVNQVLRAIKKVTGKSIDDLRSGSRVPPLPTIKAIFAEYVYEPVSFPYSKIAKILNYNDHTSVLSLFKKSLPKIKHSYDSRELYDKIHSYL